MADHALLLLGLACICAGITLALATVAVGYDDRQRVRRSLAAIAATRVGGARVLEEQERSFGDRVGGPAARRLAAVARRMSPGGVAGRIQGRLDLAGNPTAWSVDRVLAFKGLG